MAEMRLYDEIGGWGITAQEFCGELAGITGDVDLYVSSPGGSVGDALAMYAALCRHPGTVRIVVDGLAASAASVVVMGASRGHLAMAPGALLMVHDAWAECSGSAADMRQVADLLDKASGNLAAIYASRAGHGEETWRDLMLAETWFTADEAVSAGLADAITANVLA